MRGETAGVIDTVLVVRFSLRMSDEWAKIAFGGEPGRMAWMRKRAAVLRTGLERCVNRQASAVSAAYILMAIGDEAAYEELFKGSVFKPVYCQGANHVGPIARRMQADGVGKRLVISRIDSDDLIHENYFQSVLSLIDESLNEQWIVAVDGLRTNLDFCQEIHYKSSPFLSLYVREFSGQTVYAFNHERVLEKSPASLVGQSWIQVVHGSNVSNGFLLKTNEPVARGAPGASVADGKLASGDLVDFSAEDLYKVLGCDGADFRAAVAAL